MPEDVKGGKFIVGDRYVNAEGEDLGKVESEPKKETDDKGKGKGKN